MFPKAVSLPEKPAPSLYSNHVLGGAVKPFHRKLNRRTPQGVHGLYACRRVVRALRAEPRGGGHPQVRGQADAVVREHVHGLHHLRVRGFDAPFLGQDDVERHARLHRPIPLLGQAVGTQVHAQSHFQVRADADFVFGKGVVFRTEYAVGIRIGAGFSGHLRGFYGIGVRQKIVVHHIGPKTKQVYFSGAPLQQGLHVYVAYVAEIVVDGSRNAVVALEHVDVGLLGAVVKIGIGTEAVSTKVSRNLCSMCSEAMRVCQSMSKM